MVTFFRALLSSLEGGDVFCAASRQCRELYQGRVQRGIGVLGHPDLGDQRFGGAALDDPRRRCSRDDSDPRAR